MTSTEPAIVDTSSVAETLALGERIGAVLAPGSVIALEGALGSGKTHLVKGIARGCGAADDAAVTSPTFVLVNEYAGRLHLYHVDVYRLRGTDDLAALGFDEMVSAGGAVIVEWADRVRESLPVDHLRMEIAITGAESRRFTLRAGGARAARLLAAMH